jgi:hypothetical protein
MIAWIWLATLFCTCALALPLRADLASVKTERKPEKRAEKALDNAQDAFKRARNAYMEKGDLGQTTAFLNELMDSVQLAYDSLIETGKNPSKSPKHFKKAEIRTRDLLRRLADFRDQMSALDRDGIDKIHTSIQKIHDDLLAGIMGEKKD